MKRKNGWVLICCWMTYCAAYLCRVNFSSALNQLSKDLSVSVDLLSSIGAVFFIVYAFSQLINGYLGDRINPKKFIMVALVGTTICNVGISFSTTVWPVYLFWGANGYFQAMFWSTIIRILSQQTDAKTSASYSAAISTAMPAGYLISWCLLGRLLSASSSIMFFLIPSILSAIMILVWSFATPIKATTEVVDSGTRIGVKETLALMKEEKLVLLLPICVLHGLIKESAAFWLPLLIYQWFGTESLLGILLIAYMPLINVVGMFIAKRILNTQKLSKYLFLVFFGGIAVSSILLQFVSLKVPVVLLLAVISGCCYGNNTALMSYIPMQYAGKKVVASLVGIFDFCSYAGASVSVFVLSKLLNLTGFSALALIWLVVSVIACLFQKDGSFSKLLSQDTQTAIPEFLCESSAEC